MEKKKISKEFKFPSELRLDLISGDWVVIATGRSKRPETFKKEKKKDKEPKKPCPFCRLGAEETFELAFSEGKKILGGKGKKIPRNWTTMVLPNKYPAFVPYPKLDKKRENNLFQKMNAVGFHEIVITKSHDKYISKFSVAEIKEVIDSYQQRFLTLMRNKFVGYISIFHNHGKEAGASIAHPHSQIITTPLVDSDLKKALSKARTYFEEKGKCIYCEMNEWERRTKQRVVFENKDFVVICPFASKSAFEVIVSPKKHLSYFEKITEDEKWGLSEAFSEALGRLDSALSGPSFNFYLHSAPCQIEDGNYYHWHWTILPKTSTWAGFEIGTRMEISTIEPEVAAEYLRRQ